MAPDIDPGSVEKDRRQLRRPKMPARGPRSTKEGTKHDFWEGWTERAGHEGPTRNAPWPPGRLARAST